MPNAAIDIYRWVLFPNIIIIVKLFLKTIFYSNIIRIFAGNIFHI